MNEMPDLSRDEVFENFRNEQPHCKQTRYQFYIQ